MAYHRVYNESKTTDVTIEAWIAVPSGGPELTPVFNRFVLPNRQFFVYCFVRNCLSLRRFFIGTVQTLLYLFFHFIKVINNQLSFQLEQIGQKVDFVQL
jgi:hypothetical protein